MVRPMLAIAEPSARLRLVCIRLRSTARTAAIDSGSRTRSAITTPTNVRGKPAAATPASIARDSTLASPTTATRATTSNARLVMAVRVDGGSAWSSCGSTVEPSRVTGRKKSR